MKWFAQGLWKRRRGIFGWTAFTVVIVGVAVARTVDWDGPPPRTIHDPSFERSAAKICEAEIPKLRAVKREEDTDDPLEEETARQVDTVADKLEATVRRLEALDVRSADKAEVDAWFAAYASYVEAGRNYADALRGGDEDVYNRVDDQGVEPLKRIRDFAQANRIESCIP
ncbi:MAG: hypothetical protein Q8K63_00030 [Acidimicrobiales bacterium]|nr:hypothetical protein [Acidimicrobiales bacterium]